MYSYLNTFQNLYMYARLTGHSWIEHFQNFICPHQLTPLHFAAEEGHVGTAQVLIEKGADMNIKDSDGVCEWVCITNHVLIVLIRGLWRPRNSCELDTLLEYRSVCLQTTQQNSWSIVLVVCTCIHTKPASVTINLTTLYEDVCIMLCLNKL